MMLGQTDKWYRGTGCDDLKRFLGLTPWGGDLGRWRGDAWETNVFY